MTEPAITFRKDFGYWWPDSDRKPEACFATVQKGLPSMDFATELARARTKSPMVCVQAGGHCGEGMRSMSRPDVVSVLAGGASARDYDVNRLPGFVIGVNDACWRAWCDFGVTMDRLWLENRVPQIEASALTTVYARLAAYKNLVPVPDWITPFVCDHTKAEMSGAKGHLNGTNSGMCALNLAYQMAPKTVILFGFDMCKAKDGAEYWWPPYPWKSKPGGGGKYIAWAAQFAVIADQFQRAGIEVLNASPKSAIQTFHKIDPRSVLI